MKRSTNSVEVKRQNRNRVFRYVNGQAETSMPEISAALDISGPTVLTIVNELKEYHVNVDVHDPWVDAAEAEHEYGIQPIQTVEQGQYDAVILAVAHEQFKAMGAAEIRALGKAEHVLYDLKYVLSEAESDIRL